MRIIKVNSNSPFLEAIVALGDTARDTVGFLPREAFLDYARKEQIIACVEGKRLLGYLLFRRGKAVITIVQLCVNKLNRKSGIARQLVDELFESCRDIYPTLKLSCRRDYGIDGFWRSLGFVPIGEKTGRATKEETTLTVWIKTDPDSIDIFTYASLADSKKKIVLDTNIVIDMFIGNRAETQALLQPFLADYVSYYISPETFMEINSSDDKSSRNKQRDYIKQNFEAIQVYDPETYESVKTELLHFKNVDSFSNTGRDISHIAYAVASGADAFVTRDNGWLNNQTSEYVFETYGLPIMAPGELVKSIDEILYPNDYAPIQLAGLSLHYAEMTHEQFNAVVEDLYREYNDGKKRSFEQELRNWMANPQTYHLELTQSNSGTASLVVYSINTASRETRVIQILINPKIIKPQLYNTYMKRIAFRLLEEAKESNSTAVVILKSHLCPEAIVVFNECLFVDFESVLIKYLVSGIIKKGMEENPSVFPRSFIIERLASSAATTYSSLVVILEKLFWPVKIDAEDLPCYIVPIKAQYAMDLFDHNLYHTNLSLFENNQIEAALSPENVYFKNGRKLISKTPARILWYVSEDESLYNTKMIRACSYLDSIEIDTVDNLYKKYRRLGVLSRSAMSQFGDGRNFIVAYLFSYTELFSNPVSLYDARKILGNRQTFQSAVRIPQEKFLQIYKQCCEI